MKQRYWVETYDPLVIRDGETGRFAGLDAARAWCDAHGHRFGALWPDMAQLNREWEETRARAAASGRTAARWVPASRWNCEQCGLLVWYRADAKTPSEALDRQQIEQLAWASSPFRGVITP